MDQLQTKRLAAGIINVQLLQLRKKLLVGLAKPEEYKVRQLDAMFFAAHNLPLLVWCEPIWWKPWTWGKGNWKLVRSTEGGLCGSAAFATLSAR